MNKNTKTLLTIGGIAVVGYILYKQFAKSGTKSFANLEGTPSKSSASWVRSSYYPECYKLRSGYLGSSSGSFEMESQQYALSEGKVVSMPKTRYRITSRDEICKM